MSQLMQIVSLLQQQQWSAQTHWRSAEKVPPIQHTRSVSCQKANKSEVYREYEERKGVFILCFMETYTSVGMRDEALKITPCIAQTEKTGALVLLYMYVTRTMHRICHKGGAQI